MKHQLTSKEFFEGLFEQLDITPSQFKEAEQHYKAVADHLSEDHDKRMNIFRRHRRG